MSGAECLPVQAGMDGRIDLSALLMALGERGINELQVEAGETLCGSLVSERLVDELLLYQAPCLLGDRARAAFRLADLESMDQRLEFERLDLCILGDDLRLRLRPQYQAGQGH
jgi:diaminohydroxyphosphoribosylaminopyrimidine deaminase/5-amino-6-(5-phosphoribosylamino)uracil reductase